MSPQSEKQRLPRTPRAGAPVMCHRPELGHVATQMLGRWEQDCHVEVGLTTWQSATEKEGVDVGGQLLVSDTNPIFIPPMEKSGSR